MANASITGPMPEFIMDEERLRSSRLARAREQLRRHNLAAALLFDPLSIRYALVEGISVVWSLHNADRWALVPVESEPVLWEYGSAMPALRQSRTWSGDMRLAPSWSVFGSGSLAYEQARAFAKEIATELADRNILDERIGIDRLDAIGFLALQEAGVHVADAQLPLQLARAVKTADEISVAKGLGPCL